MLTIALGVFAAIAHPARDERSLEPDACAGVAPAVVICRSTNRGRSYGVSIRHKLMPTEPVLRGDGLHPTCALWPRGPVDFAR